MKPSGRRLEPPEREQQMKFSKLNASEAFQLNEKELERLIFRGASIDEERSPRDALQDCAIIAMFDHPEWGNFSQGFQAWMMAAMNAVYAEENS
tara:strand:+ start:192 stop:473 length:282 start_codon:yes stop_codon:yes gene_type:complete